MSDVKVQLLPAPIDNQQISRSESIIILGGPGYNSVSQYIEQNYSSQSKFQEDARAILIDGVQPETNTHYSFIEKIYDKVEDRALFYVAGLSEAGTMSAAHFLATEWALLKKKFHHDKEFVILLRFEEGDYKKWTIVFEKEITKRLAPSITKEKEHADIKGTRIIKKKQPQSKRNPQITLTDGISPQDEPSAVEYPLPSGIYTPDHDAYTAIFLPEESLLHKTTSIEVTVDSNSNTEEHTVYSFSTDHPISIGRTAPNDIIINHPNVSRKHVQIRLTPKGFEITDTNSTAGTFIGLDKIQLAPNAPIILQENTINIWLPGDIKIKAKKIAV